ncbi:MULTISPECIES: response regulator transcription factor [Metallibacterium]|jgi:two-component system OmpR family response regulator|uniref:winged helix-turn-helix domain-containing protein n=1 Tax=Metallibacterium TaxID=1218803 RepID=UPI0026258F29|nr:MULTISPECIES: response regulator transcription factor [Metallibacterium]MBW8075493.1 response regulator [Metallibacterium scheffleri]
MRILVIEDDNETAAYIVRGLSEHGHAVERAPTGRDGLFLATDSSYEVIVVDRMLPGMDGLTLLKTLRAADVRTPVLVLTALGEVDQRVEGLEAGADDYLVKPFVFTELLARVQALGRRPPLQEQVSALQVADLEMDLLRREVRRAGKAIELQPREFRLLEYLMRHAGEVVTRTMLLEQVWDFHFDPQTSVVETHISRLRAKIDRAHGPGRELLHTVRGAGYCLRAPA